MPKQAALSSDEFDYLQKHYLAHPDEFITDVLGAKLWSGQIEIAQSVFINKTTAVKTCNAVGKSFIAARIAIAYLMLHPSAVVVTTAPTWRQVTDVLWREIATAVKMSKYKLTDKDVTQAGLSLDTDWFAVGLSTKYPENFFGYHADHILVIVDEAGGVAEPIFKGVKAITPNRNARILYIGNPTDPSGTFFEVFDESRPVPIKRITISAFQSPNMIANNIRDVDDLLALYTPPLGVEASEHVITVNEKMALPYPELIDPAMVYERYFEWGVDSPAWQALIMGQFPTQAESALIPMNLVMQAMDFGRADNPKEAATLSGWDVKDGDMGYGHDSARFGKDLHVLTPKGGGWVLPQITWSKVDGPTAAQKIVTHINPHADVTINIDDTGNGGSTSDHLNYMKQEAFTSGVLYSYSVSPYVFGSKEQMTDAEKLKYYDVTSMLYWNLRMLFLEKKIGFTFYDKDLFYELTARQWSIVGGKIKVEDKESFKKRTGRKSPDRSDSLVLAFARRVTGKWSDSNGTDTKKPSAAGMQPITAGLDSRY